MPSPIEKEAFWSPSTKVANLLCFYVSSILFRPIDVHTDTDVRLYIYIYIYIYISGLVQYCSQHSCVIAVQLLQPFS